MLVATRRPTPVNSATVPHFREGKLFVSPDGVSGTMSLSDWSTILFFISMRLMLWFDHNLKME